MREQAMRDVLCDCFAFVGNKIKDGTVTIEDVRSMFEIVMSSTGARASIKEIARYYGKSEVNVRSVIKRRVLGKPVRRVYYDFSEVCRKVPESWHVRPSSKDD